eukprot:1327472-Amorphochlora_amoeboformis.AAC.1
MRPYERRNLNPLYLILCLLPRLPHGDKLFLSQREQVTSQRDIEERSGFERPREPTKPLGSRGGQGWEDCRGALKAG